MKYKKLILLLLVLPVIAVLIGCEKDDRIQIGILQFVEHNALSDARLGFIDGLAEAGFIDGENITITVHNPQAVQTTMASQSKVLVRKSDLILGIATPAAISLVNEANKRKVNTPILFTAVTDPIDAGLIKSNSSPEANVTGTNDMNPIKEQIGLLTKLKYQDEAHPEGRAIAKVGILYTASEPNSVIQAEIAESEAKALGLEVEIKTINTVNDLRQVATSLARSVDAIYIPTDNLISSSMGVIKQVVEQEKVLVVAGEAGMVREGGSASFGVDYYELGKLTAQMAVQILKDGKKPSEVPSIGLSEFPLILNKTQLDLIGVIIPQDLLDDAEKI